MDEHVYFPLQNGARFKLMLRLELVLLRITCVLNMIRGRLGLGALQGVHAEVPSDTTPVVHSTQPKAFDPSKSPSMSHARVRVDAEVLIP